MCYPWTHSIVLGSLGRLKQNLHVVVNVLVQNLKLNQDILSGHDLILPLMEGARLLEILLYFIDEAFDLRL